MWGLGSNPGVEGLFFGYFINVLRLLRLIFPYIITFLK